MNELKHMVRGALELANVLVGMLGVLLLGLGHGLNGLGRRLSEASEYTDAAFLADPEPETGCTVSSEIGGFPVRLVTVGVTDDKMTSEEARAFCAREASRLAVRLGIHEPHEFISPDEDEDDDDDVGDEEDALARENANKIVPPPIGKAG